MATGWLHPSLLHAASAFFTDPNDPATRLTTYLIETKEGKALLQWRSSAESPAADAAFELQYAPATAPTNWVTRYEGPDLATSVTGLPEGEHHYRVREVAAPSGQGDWSEVMVVRVVYPAMPLVLGLMALGTVVLVATVLAILRGHARHRSSSQRGRSGA